MTLGKAFLLLWGYRFTMFTTGLDSSDAHFHASIRSVPFSFHYGGCNTPFITFVVISQGLLVRPCPYISMGSQALPLT